MIIKKAAYLSTRRIIVGIITLLALTACGGGGGGGDSGGPSPQSTNKAPTLSINTQIDVLEGTAAVATATATDPDNQTLTFSLSTSADRDLFDISASGVLRFLTAPDFETPTDADSNNRYELRVSVSDSQNGSDSQNVVVNVTNAIEGRVIDAPLSGSEIYIVTTGASAANAGDSVGTSDAQGYFLIPAPANISSVQIMTRGGTDTETGVAMPDLTLMADLPTDTDASIAVTPISTVVANADTAQEKQAVLTALGITGTVDAFLSKDIWKEAKGGDNTAQSLQSTNAQIGLLISTAQSLVEGGTMAQLSEVADKVAEKIAEKASANEAIDLQADTMISEVLSDALSTMSVESTAIDAVSSNIAEINELLADGDVDPTSADAADFIEKAQTELQDAVKELVSGETSVNDFATETAMSTLFANNPLLDSQTNTGGNTATGNNDTTGTGGTGGNNDNTITAIDSEKWFHQTQLPNGWGWYNDEQQHYTNRLDNSYVSNGTLKIVAKKEQFTDQNVTKQYTSARLNSKYAFKYGRVEVKAKLPSGVGTWPAIWTLGKNISESGAYWQTQGFGTTPWPNCGEIDIMEHWGHNQDYVQSAMHTPSSNGNTINHGGQHVPAASTEFHVYSMEWSANEIIFAVDDNEHYRYAPVDKNASTWPFDAPQYLLMNFAIQPSIGGDFNEDQMEVDYVRIYAPGAAPGDAPQWSDEFE